MCIKLLSFHPDAAIFKEAESLDEDEKQAILIVNPGKAESKIYRRTIFEENGLWLDRKSVV